MTDNVNHKMLSGAFNTYLLFANKKNEFKRFSYKVTE